MTHNKMLEAQIAQKASFSSKTPNKLPSKPELNPSEQCNALILNGGKQLEGRKEGTNEESLLNKN